MIYLIRLNLLVPLHAHFIGIGISQQIGPVRFRIKTLARRVDSFIWIRLYSSKNNNSRGRSPWLAAALRHHDEGRIDSAHWLLAIYTSCCCCIQMDLGHPLFVRDTAVPDVPSYPLLSGSANKFFYPLHAAQHHIVIEWGKKGAECSLGYQGSHLLFNFF